MPRAEHGGCAPPSPHVKDGKRLKNELFSTRAPSHFLPPPAAAGQRASHHAECRSDVCHEPVATMASVTRWGRTGQWSLPTSHLPVTWQLVSHAASESRSLRDTILTLEARDSLNTSVAIWPAKPPRRKLTTVDTAQSQRRHGTDNSSVDIEPQVRGGPAPRGGSRPDLTGHQAQHAAPGPSRVRLLLPTPQPLSALATCARHSPLT